MFAEYEERFARFESTQENTAALTNAKHVQERDRITRMLRGLENLAPPVETDDEGE